MEAATTRLAAADIGWLTTVSADGRPQSSPVWFVHDDGDIWVASEPEAAKVANVAARPAASFHLEGAAPGDLVVTLEGHAGLADAMPASYAAKYEDGCRRIGTTAERYLARFSAVVRITPTRWRVFASL